MTRRIIGSMIGLAYALGYGFWTLMLTGGGHGNFLWMTAFLYTYFVGLFFPVAGFLVADLRQLFARVALTTLLFLNLFATIAFFGWMPSDGWDDMKESWVRIPVWFVLLSALHCLPTVVLWVRVLRAMQERDEIVGEFE